MIFEPASLISLCEGGMFESARDRCSHHYERRSGIKCLYISKSVSKRHGAKCLCCMDVDTGVVTAGHITALFSVNQPCGSLLHQLHGFFLLNLLRLDRTFKGIE